MPSFLGRLFGVSFRTERLIMTFIGLVNSTLDWHPLKWTNKLEQIWNLTLSQETLILDTIGEERIKSVLSYIVIARILIAHVFTLSYLINFYPIITWSRPNLLLPWLVLSFFKNVVLEGIVMAVGLLIWYDKRFSLPIFLEFVLVKVVPLLFASYNWYCNSCLYLKLRRIEETRNLTRNMRSDPNLIATRLCLKIAESKYRTRSVTTLISWESYDTHDTSDTISRIIENPHLSPAQKAVRILGLTEQEIDEARVRIREREIRRRLTEEEDEDFLNSPRDLSRYLSMVSQYDFGKESLKTVRNECGESEFETKGEKSHERSRNRIGTSETGGSNFVLDNPPTSNHPLGNPRDLSNASPTPKTKDSTPEVLQNPKSNSSRTITDHSPNANPTNSGSNLASVTDDFTTKTEERSPSNVIDAKKNSSSSKKQDPSDLYYVRNIIQDAEKICSPVKSPRPFTCNCLPDDYRFQGKMEICCLSRNVAMRTSTPNNSPEKGRKVENFEDTECPSDQTYHTCDNDFMTVNEIVDSRRDDDLPLMGELLQKDLDVLRSMEKIEGGFVGDMNEYRCDERVSMVEKNETVAVSKLFNGQGAIGVRDFSKILKNLTVTSDIADSLEAADKTKAGECETRMNNENEIRRPTIRPMNSAANNATSSVRKSSLNTYIEGVGRELLSINLPEYSFGDTNTPMFYEDSMKVFDGCYEKDFANNSELQCLLQQLEKKKWSLFPGQTNREVLLPNNLLTQNDQLTMQNLRAAYHLTSDFENMNRYEISVPPSLKTDRERVISRIVQMNENPSQNTSIRTKDAFTQITDDFPTRRATCVLKDARKRRKSLRRKRLKNDNVNTSPTNDNRQTNTELHNTFWRDNSKLSARRKLPKTLDAQKRPPHLAKSLSDRSVCECRMPQMDSKHSVSSITKADRKNEGRRSTAKCRVDNFATLTLPQVGKPSMLDEVYPKKPPVYPKRIQSEVPARTVTSATSSKRSSDIKRLLDLPKKTAERQATPGAKKLKWKGKTESSVEQEAKELRALKAYNEMTLLEDKKELEARKKLPSARSSADDVAEGLKYRSQSRQARLKQDNPRSVEQMNDAYFGKENFLADAATETETMAALQPREAKVFVAGEKFEGISNDVHPCSKLSKVNKITGKLLENFDRLRRGQTKIGIGKSKQSVETDTRKLCTKYIKPKKLMKEENVSVASAKRIDVAQRGRELERMLAKKDVRNRPTVSSEDVLPVVEDRHVFGRTECTVEFLAGEIDRGDEIVTAVDGEEDYGSFATITSTEMKNVVSIWPSGTIDEEDEPVLLVQSDTKAANQRQPAAKTGEEMKDEEDKTAQLQETESEIRTLVGDPDEERVEPSQSNEEFVPLRLAADSTYFARNIEVTCTRSSVILSNPSVPKGVRPQWRSIVDDDTIRMLHHAFSDRSIYLILELSGEMLPMNDMLNNRQPRLGHDEINFHPNVETMGTIMEELPPLPHEEQNFGRQFLATICRLRNADEIIHQEGDPCGPIVLALNPEIDADIEYGGMEPIEMNHLEMNDVLPTVFRFLGCPGERELNLVNVSADNYEILRGMMVYEVGPRRMEEGNQEDEEVEDEEDEMMERLLRFVVEDICTDIRFPVVVRWSEIVITTFDTSSDVPEEMDEALAHIEPSKVNLFSLEDNAHEVITESDTSTEKCYGDVDEIDAAKTSGRNECPILNLSFASGRFVNFDDHGIVEGVLDARRLAGSLEGASNGNNYFVKTVNTLISPWVERSFGDDENRTDENRGCNNDGNVIYRVIEESLEAMDDRNNFRSDGLESSQIVEDKGRTEFEDEVTEEIQFPLNEPADFRQESLPFDLNAEQRDKCIELNKGVTFKIILTFWLVVIYFYVVYFCRKILAFGQISRTTSTLKPFEIHTVPTSTTTLLENAKLIGKLQTDSVPEIEEYWVEYGNENEDEDGSEEEEDDEEYSYSLPEIIDHEIGEPSCSNEHLSLPNFDSAAFQNLSDYSETESERSATKVESDVERTMMYIIERVTENVRILPFFASDENIIANHQEEEWEGTTSSSNTEIGASRRLEFNSQGGTSPVTVDDKLNFIRRSNSFLGEEERKSSGRELELSTVPKLNSQSTSPITSDDQLNSARRVSDSIAPTSSSKTETGKRLVLHLTRKDLEGFRCEGDDGSSGLKFSATCDDEATSSSRARSSFLYAEIEIKEVIDAPDTEETPSRDGNEESTSSIAGPPGERYRVSNRQGGMRESNETDNDEEVGTFKRDAADIAKSVEENATTISPGYINTYMQSADSFDSTYTDVSDTSQNRTSVGDLNASSMEEFPIATCSSNESN